MDPWKDNLPPYMKARLAAAGETGASEKDSLKGKEFVHSVLARFYRGDLDSNALCQELRGATLTMIREAQINLIDSLSLSYSSHAFDQRRAAILGLEDLKDDPRKSAIEGTLNRIGHLQSLYRESQEEVLEELDQEKERHFEDVAMRTRRMALQAVLSADAEVTERLAESLLEAERKYGDEFAAVNRQLKRQVEGIV
jgi:benzoyl-CoA reductase/2-hydroxyglutaryl-CoA dehydratase subunit BcrC/BadD/HgdB